MGFMLKDYVRVGFIGMGFWRCVAIGLINWREIRFVSFLIYRSFC